MVSSETRYDCTITDPWKHRNLIGSLVGGVANSTKCINSTLSQLCLKSLFSHMACSELCRGWCKLSPEPRNSNMKLFSCSWPFLRLHFIRDIVNVPRIFPPIFTKKTYIHRVIWRGAASGPRRPRKKRKGTYIPCVCQSTWDRKFFKKVPPPRRKPGMSRGGNTNSGRSTKHNLNTSTRVLFDGGSAFNYIYIYMYIYIYIQYIYIYI